VQVQPPCRRAAGPRDHESPRGGQSDHATQCDLVTLTTALPSDDTPRRGRGTHHNTTVTAGTGHDPSTVHTRTPRRATPGSPPPSSPRCDPPTATHPITPPRRRPAGYLRYQQASPSPPSRSIGPSTRTFTMTQSLLGQGPWRRCQHGIPRLRSPSARPSLVPIIATYGVRDLRPNWHCGLTAAQPRLSRPHRSGVPCRRPRSRLPTPWRVRHSECARRRATEPRARKRVPNHDRESITVAPERQVGSSPPAALVADGWPA